MAAHEDIHGTTCNHGIHRWNFADETARFALNPTAPELPLSAADHGVVGHQQDNDSYWVLIDYTNVGNAAGWCELTNKGLSPNTDELVKVSSNDAVAKYLINALAAGANVTITELNNGGDEDAEIAVNMDLDDLGDVNAPTPADCEVLKWDNATGKWIPADVGTLPGSGVSSAPIHMGYNGNANSTGGGRWLQYHHNIPSSQAPLVMDGAKTLETITMKTDQNETAGFEIYKNGASVHTFTFTNQQKKRETGIGVAFAADDELSVKLTSGSFKDPILVMWFE
jgi:hypothetical protein